MISRRDFVKSLAIGTGTLLVAPRLLFAEPEESQQAIVKPIKVKLEVIVDDIADDYLSRDYHLNGRDSIIHQSLEATQQFYLRIGQEYGLQGVDIELVEPSTEQTREDGIIRFRYVAWDKLMERIENDQNLAENMCGERFSDEEEQSFKRRTIEMFRQRGEKIYGLCYVGTREIFLIPKNWFYLALANTDAIEPSNIDIDSKLINFCGRIICHELGHAFGLPHVGETPENRDNVMTTCNSNSSNPFSKRCSNLELNQEQVRTVLMYCAALEYLSDNKD